ncbi:hypothetical protein BK666_01675 [Pseudomonas frederiksbergensis]|uniref:Uncharacterized protein n=1 Tax=Pseudomonas frederiksbergensis TaxID=104087 RepID=A0A423KI41_9PSED|nr:hypothetical protein BK666_01675 [Pseudomonas frederiksbergensis]
MVRCSEKAKAVAAALPGLLEKLNCCGVLDLIVPTLCVGMQPVTLCVTSVRMDAERPVMHSHAERGNDQWML